MDDPLLNGNTHRHALAALRRINWLSRSDRVVWKEILSQAKANSPERPLTILDIAAGGGDLAMRLARLAERDGVSVTIDGCDISPTALGFAAHQAAACNVTTSDFFSAMHFSSLFHSKNTTW